MTKRIVTWILLPLLLLTGCVSVGTNPTAAPAPAVTAPQATLQVITGPPETAAPETEAPTLPPETPYPDPTPSPFALDEDGEYTAPMDVAAYLAAYGHLPGNFITKNEARKLGWPGGDLWAYAPGKSIGGDSFGNREGVLPEGTRYHECDVNYAGGSRGAERLIYGDDGSVWYTDDHYESFTQLY